MTFRDRYGPWAVIAGASEGVGRAFAHAIAANGVHCILVARREGPLLALRQEIVDEGGADCIIAPLDLAAPDAFDRLTALVGEREVGLYVNNAGADPQGAQFLDRDIALWREQVRRNIDTLLLSCHYFGQRMRQRKRGGLLLVGSGACYGGGSFMSVYSASKAFQLCLAESLWAELQPFGVDVLYLALGATDTPALRTLLADKGLPLPPDLAVAADAAALGLARLADGPVCNFGQADDDAGMAPNSPSERRARILAIGQSTRRIFGDGATSVGRVNP